MALNNDNRISLRNMVASVRHDKHNNYWKLSPPAWYRSTKDIKAELKRRGYDPGSSTSPEWLNESLIRYELGQTSYVKCTIKELRNFVKARRIDARKFVIAGGQRHSTKAGLIALLDDADQHPTFPHFMALPAEIRNEIYTLHFAYFTSSPLPHPPIQPPITLASKALRAETLTMFYAMATFPIALEQYHDRMISPPQIHLRIPLTTLGWFQALTPVHAAAIRKLRFDTAPNPSPPKVAYSSLGMSETFRNDLDFAPGQLAWFEVEIFGRDGEEKGVKVWFPVGPSCESRPRQARERNVLRMRRQVRKVVAEMDKRVKEAKGGKEMGFLVEDLKALRSAMEQ